MCSGIGVFYTRQRDMKNKIFNKGSYEYGIDIADDMDCMAASIIVVNATQPLTMIHAVTHCKRPHKQDRHEKK